MSQATAGARKPMPTWLKRSLIGAGSVVGVILLAAILVPILFKDTIKEKVQQAVNENVNADVRFSDLDLSLLRNFPSLTISLENLEVVCRGAFSGDTLVAAKEVSTSVGLWSAITGGPIEIKSVFLDVPRIHARVLTDGRANWDIAKPDTSTQPSADTAASDMRIALKHYEVRNGRVVYDDKSLTFYLRIDELNHSGSGDFTATTFDLDTYSEIHGLYVSYDSVSYLADKHVEGTAGFGIDLAQSKYTFRDNRLKLNDLDLEFAGFIQLPDDERMVMDLTFGAPNATFRQLLSLVPGIYSSSFKDLKAEGNVALAGAVKGTYSSKELPGFEFSTSVENGSFQYASVPQPVTGVQLALRIASPGGADLNLNNLEVNLSKLEAMFGPNPLKAALKSKGLTPITLDGFLLAKLDLANLTQLFPMEGYDLRGKLNIDAKAKGTYGPKSMPSVQALLQLADGYVKTSQFPAAIENFRVDASVQDDKGTQEDLRINVRSFHLELDKEPVDGRLAISNLTDPLYDVFIKGKLDLEKLAKLYPIEGTTMAGRIAAEIDAKGRVSDVTGKRFDKLKTSGLAQVQGLSYTSREFPQGLRITTAQLSFSPQNISLDQYEGFLGQSDLSVQGSLSNYIPFLFKEGEVLRGNMILKSKKFNCNEFMASGEAPAADTASAPMKAVQIPANIDFLFSSQIGEVNYDNLTLTNLSGAIQVKDRTVRLIDVLFNTLGGKFTANGGYSTRNPDAPHVDFDLKLENLDIQQTYSAFNTIQTLAPVAKFTQGKFTTSLRMSTDLQQNMMPNLSTLSASGVADIFDAAVRNLPILTKLGEVAKISALSSLDNLSLNQTHFNFDVQNGRLNVKPFDVKLGQYTARVGGSNGLGGDVDYTMAVEVPSGQAGQMASSYLSNLTGRNVAVPANLNLNFKVGGTVLKPTITPAGVGAAGSGSTDGGVAGGVTTEVKQQVQGQVDQAKQALSDTVGAARKAMEAKAAAEQERLRQEAEKAKEDAARRAREEADRIKREAAEKLRRSAGGLFRRDSL